MKLLLSARDPAAAYAIKNVVLHAQKNNNFEVMVLASSPALQILDGLRCDVESIEEHMASDINSLRKKVKFVLMDFVPDAILVGSSGPDVGVDEILLEQRSPQCRTYVIQDFWGDINKNLGVYADCYFVLDEFAEIITRRQIDREMYIVGSVKQEHYSELDPCAMRLVGREKIDGLGSGLLIGYFGMPLGYFGGYWRTLEFFCDVMSSLSRTVTILYRPHPKENHDEVERSLSMLRRTGFSVYFDRESIPERSIVSCDLVVSCYSSCGFDNILLNKVAGKLISSSLFLLYDPEIYSFYREYAGLSDVPSSEQNMSISVKEKPDLLNSMGRALSTSYREELESNIKARIPQLGSASDKLLEKIWEDMQCFKTV